jgi:hypothetical protein
MARALVTMGACVVLLWAVTAPAAMTDEQKCLSGVIAAKGKYEQCVQKWLAKGLRVVFLDPAKLPKCWIKYNKAWAKLQGLGTHPPCTAASRYTDNGDGTVTDNLTGLVWEKKTNLDGVPNGGDLHDADNTYTWSTGSPYAEDGTAFTTFLSGLNTGAGFAGSKGWRLPTYVELLTILLPEEYPCSTQPCIDTPTFGPTQSDYYWSSTLNFTAAEIAWEVYFTDGIAYNADKILPSYVRAVRGGW